ncbi:MAG: NADH-quinone oxidoreductase subunit NuoN [Actinobacteria bacterium]|nr:NADH-quinone oxidoreductase subunit NuoN [Actinomycetota bacterium]
MAIMLAEAALPRVTSRVLLIASLLIVAGAAGITVALWGWDGEPTVLAGMVATDRFAVLIRGVLLAVAAIGAVYGHHQFDRAGERRPEFFPLLLFATTGMTLIAAASDLILTFLALEILSLSLYVLAGFSRRVTASEASMKYFLLGAFSSAFFLYGVALAYGATGTTSIGGIARALSGPSEGLPLAMVAAALLAVGFSFKVAAVPFHMWTPDVYQGAPTAVVGFMSAATKVAAFAALIRVFNVAFLPLSWDWTPIVGVLAAVTMVVGSLLAIAQTDVKRMLAYSSIAHAGFILTGVMAANQEGIASATFYLVAYALMIVGAFGVVLLVSGDERTSLSSYAGLAVRSPLLAALLSLFLLSLAGIPPTAGFMAKVSVFRAAVDAGHTWVVIVAVLASVVAAFFYLRVIVLVYMKEPEEELQPDRSPLPALTVAVPAVATLVLGVFPGLVFGLLETASIFRW